MLGDLVFEPSGGDIGTILILYRKVIFAQSSL